MSNRLYASIMLYVALYGVVAPNLGVAMGPGCKDAQEAISACQGLVAAQDASIANLKAANKELADRLADSQQNPLLPGWAWLGIGAAVGALGIVYLLHK